MQAKLFLSLLIIWTADYTQLLSETVCTDVKFADSSDSVRIFYIQIRTEFMTFAHPYTTPEEQLLYNYDT